MVKGIGVDMVDVARFRGVLVKWRERFMDRLFSMEERDFCLGKKDPAPHFAVRFAAKEAFVKALGTGFGRNAAPRDIEVKTAVSGKPCIRVSGRAGRAMKAMDADRVYLSLSHDKGMGIAMVILEGKETP